MAAPRSSEDPPDRTSPVRSPVSEDDRAPNVPERSCSALPASSRLGVYPMVFVFIIMHLVCAIFDFSVRSLRSDMQRRISLFQSCIVSRHSIPDVLCSIVVSILGEGS